MNYGRALKRYLLERVTLLHIHRFDPSDVQFADALVSSAVVWFRNELPPTTHQVRFTFGGSLSRPTVERTVPARALAQEAKWTRFPVSAVRLKSTLPTISDFFTIKRGVATGDNSFFILSEATIKERGLPLECLTDFAKSALPRGRRNRGRQEWRSALRPAALLLDPDLPEDEIETRLPKLWAYLQEGRAKRLHEGYLCSHRPFGTRRKIAELRRSCAPTLECSDTKNGRPFRFILNNSKATVANVISRCIRHHCSKRLCGKTLI